MANLFICFYIFIGGGIGAVLRYLFGLQAVKLAGDNFPVGTLFINITGSLLMGLIAGYFMLNPQQNNELRLFLMVGCLGGYTTFSSFSLDTVELFQRGELALAIIYILCSVIFSILAAFVGLMLIRMMLR